MNVKTIEIEIAVMKALNVRRNLIVPNVSWGLCANYSDGGALHECDIIALSNVGYATEIEIKVSKYDLLKDKEKRHHHIHNLISRLYFAVPESLKDIALENIPERAGLYVVRDVNYLTGYNNSIQATRRVVDEVHGAKRNMNAIKWNEVQRYQLARLGAMRILGLKEKICKPQTSLA